MDLRLRPIFLSLVLWMTVGYITPIYGQQKVRLAEEYYNSGEYEKAATLYEELYKQQPQNKSYFNLYIQCLIDLRDNDKASKIINDEIKKSPNDVVLYVTLGNLYEKQGLLDKANTQFNKAVDNMPADQVSIANLGSTFAQLAKYDLAIKTYQKGEKITNLPHLYAYYLADLHRRQGNYAEMIKYYLIQSEKENNSYNTQTSLSRYLPETEYEELQRQCYAKIQEETKSPIYGELLQWTYTQKKDFLKALRQAKALDLQFDENGQRPFQLGDVALEAKDYNAAVEAYDYIVTTKDRNSSYYLEAKRKLLYTKKLKVTENYNYTQADLLSLKQEYKSFLADLGKNSRTAAIMQEWADFEAIYLNELDTAIIILEELRTFGGLSPESIARAKIALADYYLMSGERWEASLLYSQVDKDFKEGVLGEQARYRNAKLSYYSGDFEWAQEQFKILKTATSKLISNDAIDMSVFILDNLGLDTTEQTMMMFAQADLLGFQNKYDIAIRKLDSITIVFPEHTLEDDVMYVKAKIYKKLRKTDDAIKMYNLIIEKFNEEIRADDALYELATLYDVDLKDTAKAMPLYEKLFLDYSGSTYAVEARNRFRVLKGDNVQ
jgi:tetratricopeptide (TPR) repeat protein